MSKWDCFGHDKKDCKHKRTSWAFVDPLIGTNVHKNAKQVQMCLDCGEILKPYKKKRGFKSPQNLFRYGDI